MSSEQNLFESDADLRQRLEGDPWVKEHVSAFALTEFLDSAKVDSGHVAHFRPRPSKILGKSILLIF